jgi:hypothetical protein
MGRASRISAAVVSAAAALSISLGTAQDAVALDAAPAVTPPCAAFHATTRQPDPQLGDGISLSTGHEGNLFPAGDPVALTVDGATADTVGQQLQVKVRNRRHVVATSTVPIASTDGEAAPMVAVPATPGWYEVSATRLAGDTVLGSACLWYGVAARGTSFDLDGLPAGKDWGGGSATRQVALAAEMHLGLVRAGISVAQFQTDPTYALDDITSAARLARQDGITFVVQIGQGGDAELAAVKDGTWGALVQQIVATYPAVHWWEAWNEPNSYWFYKGGPSAYVHRILEPFAAAVRAANPDAKVIGGSACGDDRWWWGRFAAEGGFGDVDAVGIHPYAQDWRAPESAGTLDILRYVNTLMARYDVNKPVFDTESAWPSEWDGLKANIWRQSDFIARKLVIERSLGVKSSEFLPEGGWQDWDVVDYYRGVKPGAMSMSFTDSVLHGRHFQRWMKSHRKGVRIARFGPSSSDPSALAVAWSTTKRVHLRLSCRTHGYDEFGAREPLRGRTAFASSLTFVHLKAGKPCFARPHRAKHHANTTKSG